MNNNHVIPPQNLSYNHCYHHPKYTTIDTETVRVRAPGFQGRMRSLLNGGHCSPQNKSKVLFRYGIREEESHFLRFSQPLKNDPKPKPLCIDQPFGSQGISVT